MNSPKLTNRSGTVTASATAQDASTSTERSFLLVANPDETRPFWFNAGADATAGGAGSIYVGPGAAFIFDVVVPSGRISICGATAGQPFTVKEA